MKEWNVCAVIVDVIEADTAEEAEEILLRSDLASRASDAEPGRLYGLPPEEVSA